MKIFLAARPQRRAEIARRAADLIGLGYSVTSSWLTRVEPLYGTGHVEPMGPEPRRNAISDRDDIDAADMILSFTESHGKRFPDGGRHVAFGIGLALGKKMWIVGDAENDYHAHPAVRQFNDWQAARASLIAELPVGAVSHPVLNLGPEADDYSIKLWEKHGMQTVMLHRLLDRYVPALSQKVAAYRDSRRAIYAAIIEAWRAAGRPFAFTGTGDGVSPETAKFSEHEAATKWYDDCMQLARIDRSLEDLQTQRELAVASLKAGTGLGEQIAGGAPFPINPEALRQLRANLAGKEMQPVAHDDADEQEHEQSG